MECLHIPELPYGEFSEQLHRKGGEQRLPLGASIELTERCNLKCAHCYINRPAGDQEAKKRELSHQQWVRLLDEMAAAGCLWLLLTGGEPLLRPDFRDLYLHAKKLGMIVTLFTNGTLITPEIADFLHDYPPFVVEITVYGRTKATYEAVTRVSGSYEKCLRGIDLLLASQIPLKLKTMVMTLNDHELWDLKEWAEGLGVTFRYDPVLNTRLDGGKDPLDMRLPPEQVVEIEIQDNTRLQQMQDYVKKFWGPLDSDYLYYCGAGVNSFHVDAYGKLFVCMMSREAGFDLTQGSLQRGWQEFFPQILQQKPQRDYPCNRCPGISLCGQCPGFAQLEHGDSGKLIPYHCRLTHMRAEALGIKF